MGIRTIKWTVDSMNICKDLRRELEFWLYGPNATDPDEHTMVPTEQHMSEFANALFERRECRLTEAESVVG